jgi:beta-N-acetylhexosaminidase
VIRTIRIFLLLLINAGAFLYSQQITFESELPREELVDRLLEQMDSEALLGQVLMLGYMGETASDTILEWITEHKIGGIKVFGWNANDLNVLSDTIAIMQKAATGTDLKVPLIVATDQEGGWVRHIKGNTSITPGNMALGASGLPYDAYTTGLYIGKELRALGINMNFAPTVDVFLNPLADVVGPRAFSDNPVQTGLLGTAFFKGMDEAGVISTAKHFPGHGNADKDSHGTLPVILSNRDFLEQNDLVPYRMMIKEGLPAIMAGHLAFPNITGDERPASLSPVFLKKILREEMGFQGLVITDDLVMHGAQYQNKSLPVICETALRSGSDFLLVSRNPTEHEKIWNHLLPVMKEDPEFHEMVYQAARRVLTAKVSYLKREDSVPLIPEYSEEKNIIPAEGSQDFFFNQAARSTTVIRKENIPISETKRVLIAGLFSDYRSWGSQFFPDSDVFRIPYSFNTSEKWSLIDDILSLSSGYDYILFSLSRYQDLRILSELEILADKIIILSSLTPVYMNDLPWVKDAVAVYGTGKESYIAGFAAVRGDFIPTGTLPIPLEE